MSVPLSFNVGKPVTVSTVVTMKPVPVGISVPGSGTIITKASVWTGEGPPHLVAGAQVGDEYLDTLTSILYELKPGA